MGARGEILEIGTAKRVLTSTALTVADIQDYNSLRIDTAGCVITFPEITVTTSVEYSRQELLVQNGTSGIQFLFFPDGLLNDGECVAVAPYATVRVGVIHSMQSTPEWTWVIEGAMPEKVMSYTPTETYTTATPTTTVNFLYLFKNGTVFFTMKVTSTDGAGATNATYSLPIRPLLSGAIIPVAAHWTVGTGNPANALGYVDATTNGNLAFANPQTCTDDSSFELVVSGFYEVCGWDTWTVTETWGTGTPTSITEVARYKQFGDVILFAYYASSADSTGASSLVVPLPQIPQDLNTYLAVNSIQLAGAGGATYSNPKGYIDCTHATAANRYLTFADFTTATDNQAVMAAAAGWYPVRAIETGTMTPTWGTADPASPTVTEMFAVDGSVAFLSLYMTSADGNAASSCELTPMFPARKACEKIALAGYEIVNATKSDPAAFIDADQDDWEDRTLQFGVFDAWDNAQTSTMYVSGIVLL